MSTRKYLQYPSVKGFLTDTAVRSDDVKLVIYDTFTFKVIPNPENDYATSGCKETWDAGMYVGRTQMYCPKAVFDDAKHWDE
jgi:hypothetical protein